MIDDESVVLDRFVAAVEAFGFARAQELARAGNQYERWCTYLGELRDADELARAVRAAEAPACQAIIQALSAGGAEDRARELSLAVLGCPSLHRLENLVHTSLWDLVVSPDEAVFAALLPFAFRTWAGGGVVLRRSTCPRRAELLVEYLEAQPPRIAATSPSWPRLGEVAADATTSPTIAIDDAIAAAQVKAVGELLPAAGETRARMLGFLHRAFARASSAAMRTTAAAALHAAGEHGALADLVDDADAAIRRVAFTVCLAREPRRFFPAAVADPSEVVRLIGYRELATRDPGWLFEQVGRRIEPKPAYSDDDLFWLSPLLRALGETCDATPAWFEVEPRWAAALVGLRAHAPPGRASSALSLILNALPRELVRASLPPPPPTPVRRLGGAPRTAAPRWLARYQAGEHDTVWTELRAVGDDFGSAARLTEARRVALATMERARRALVDVATRLRVAEYPLPRAIGVRARASAKPPAKLAKLAKVGPLPLALEAFYTVVGSVDLVPADPHCRPILRLTVDELDPLQLAGLDDALFEYDAWKEECDASAPALVGPLHIQLCADRFGKAHLSGGSASSIALPDASADPLIAEEERSLVDYLRFAVLERGGLPGLDPGRRGAKALLARLTRGLEPF